MSDEKPGNVTSLLRAWCDGDGEARNRVFAEVYEELRRHADHQLAGERVGHTLTPTALVNEAYLRLVGLQDIAWKGHTHFLAAGAGAMRRILIEHARARRAVKRDGGVRVTLADDAVLAKAHDVELLTLDSSLEELARQAPRHAQIIELRYFGGLSITQTADYLGISPATVKRDWQVARAWLFRRLSEVEPENQ